MALGSFGPAVASAIILNARAQKIGIDPWSWVRHHIKPIAPLPKEFLEHIEQSNREKPDAPLALVLRAEADHNGAFSSSPYLQTLSKMAQTHRVIIKTISNSFAWRYALQGAERELGEKVSVLYPSGHGEPGVIEYGISSYWNFFNRLEICDLHAEDFDSLKPDAVILLYSCNVGQELASKMAEVSKRTVLAVKTKQDPFKTVFNETASFPQLLAYDKNGALLTHAFFPDGTSEPLSVTEETKKMLFAEKLEDLKADAIAAALKGDGRPAYEMAKFLESGEIVEKSEEEAVYFYQISAEQGHAPAQLDLGITYMKGTGGVVQSDQEALRWFFRAAEQNESEAERLIGFFYQQGLGGLEQSEMQALQWIQRAADHGNTKAQWNLGLFYEQGKAGLKKSEEEALRLYRLSAEKGDAMGQLLTGLSYKCGRGTAVSEKDALHWYTLSAEQGNSVAQFELGIFHERGAGGLEPSGQKAFFWYSKAAEQEHVLSQYKLGIFYAKGRGVEQSDELAFHWKLKAAKQGDASAQNSVGVAYQLGRGVEQSDENAYHWYTQAAKQEEISALFNLGFFHEEGRAGLEKSDAEAAYYYRLSAEKDHEFSQFMMGVFYEEGRGGLSTSPEEAKKWYDRLGSPEQREEIRQAIAKLRTPPPI